ncbi:hypothetical protein [Porphyrobacter sp. AAP82]|uniref:hypothetical protein n=1 Tax=Porphyrobacter sp. AAP82 TaxID=1248917 RepID=UPI0002DA8C1D|nr:hypothetical protein [Porphyrobacter sp. AAP82]
MTPGKVLLRADYGRGSGEPQGAFAVATLPPIPHFCQRFWVGNSRDPFAKALGFAVGTAAALRWELVDETGRIAPAMCAALVAERIGEGGATVTPIEAARQRRAERAAGG